VDPLSFEMVDPDSDTGVKLALYFFLTFLLFLMRSTVKIFLRWLKVIRNWKVDLKYFVCRMEHSQASELRDRSGSNVLSYEMPEENYF
jgi:hypothetical protein